MIGTSINQAKQQEPLGISKEPTRTVHFSDDDDVVEVDQTAPNQKKSTYPAKHVDSANKAPKLQEEKRKKKTFGSSSDEVYLTDSDDDYEDSDDDFEISSANKKRHKAPKSRKMSRSRNGQRKRQKSPDYAALLDSDDDDPPPPKKSAARVDEEALKEKEVMCLKAYCQRQIKLRLEFAQDGKIGASVFPITEKIIKFVADNPDINWDKSEYSASQFLKKMKLDERKLDSHSFKRISWLEENLNTVLLQDLVYHERQDIDSTRFEVHYLPSVFPTHVLEIPAVRKPYMNYVRCFAPVTAESFPETEDPEIEKMEKSLKKYIKKLSLIRSRPVQNDGDKEPPLVKELLEAHRRLQVDRRLWNDLTEEEQEKAQNEREVKRFYFWYDLLKKEKERTRPIQKEVHLRAIGLELLKDSNNVVLNSDVDAFREIIKERQLEGKELRQLQDSYIKLVFRL